MIYYGCPRCEGAMASADSKAGSTEVCRACGNVAVVPAPARVATTSDLRGESACKQQDNEPECLLWSGSPSHWGYLSGYVAATLLLISAAGLAIAGDQDLLSPALVGLSLSVAIVLGCVIAKMGTSYTVTTRWVSSSFSFIIRRVRRVPLGPIREVTLSQGILGRIVGIGNVGFSTSASTQQEVVFRAIPAPLSVQSLVESRIIQT